MPSTRPDDDVVIVDIVIVDSVLAFYRPTYKIACDTSLNRSNTPLCMHILEHTKISDRGRDAEKKKKLYGHIPPYRVRTVPRRSYGLFWFPPVVLLYVV